MNIDLVTIGKTDSAQIEALVDMYLKRINRYTRFNIISIPDLRNTKNISAESQKRQEGALLLKMLNDSDHVILLDEKGHCFRSMEFAFWLQKKMASGIRKTVFVIGGPYGFSKDVYARANDSISLSRMTFSHQIVRAIFTEQLYRAFTILNNEPYHHE